MSQAIVPSTAQPAPAGPRITPQAGVKVILQFELLPSNNGVVTLELGQRIAFRSRVLMDRIEDMSRVRTTSAGEFIDEEVVIPMTNDDPIAFKAMADVFAYVGEYLNRDPNGKETREVGELQEWEIDFFKPFTQGDLFNFLIQADFLDIKRALDTGALIVAKEIQGKTPEKLRYVFKIPQAGEAEVTVTEALESEREAQ